MVGEREKRREDRGGRFGGEWTERKTNVWTAGWELGRGGRGVVK